MQIERAFVIFSGGLFRAEVCLFKNRILIYGGSRYFTGEYFHGILTLQCGHDGRVFKHKAQEDGYFPLICRRHVNYAVPGVIAPSTLGLIGRFRGMYEAGIVDVTSYKNAKEQMVNPEPPQMWATGYESGGQFSLKFIIRSKENKDQ